MKTYARFPKMLVCACLLVLLGGTGWAKIEKQTMPDGVESLAITKMVQPIFPMTMTLQGVLRGDVAVVIGVDAQGKLDDYIITSYSRKDFAEEVEKAIKEWIFTPMRVNGTPVWSRTSLTFNFQASGVVVTRTVIDSLAMLGGDMLERTYRVDTISRTSELDGALVVRQVVSPVYPSQLANSKQTGTVMMDFYVDGEGRVRLPVIDSAEGHSWFGDSAAQALLEWRFAPPMKNGRPTMVRVRQQFVFSPN